MADPCFALCGVCLSIVEMCSRVTATRHVFIEDGLLAFSKHGNCNTTV